MRMIARDTMRLLLLAWAWAGIGWSAPGHAQALSEPLRRPAAPEYDVVALRVEFQPDTTRFSTGDGTFAGDLYEGLAPSIDPLPHDAAYFEAHLAFLEDYVARVSDGQTVVRTHLIPDVVRLPRPMGAYAPVGLDADSDAERAKLARMVREAWKLAGETIDFDMSRFTPGRTALLLFHAGVGRDTELSGTTLDRTPEDLPSIFFDADALRRLGAGGAAFRGFPVDHALVLPRTETRLGTDPFSNERYLLELSINGLLAATFFNFLGAPDLFDTETGESAIGPFGLMDGLGIFAYGGLFPPEPMAWTKYFLGWADPVDLVGDGPETVRLRAASLPEVSDAVRARVSDAEYFLVENRFRDPEGDGLTLRVFKEGQTIEQRVENGDSLFNHTSLRGFAGGVVTGADGYDWALPGGVDSDGKDLNGGVLIWHVDERRLRAALGDRAVNAGGRRAIDLEEADGPQDIGYPSVGLFGHRRHLGTPYDFFYARDFPEETPYTELYRNRFGPDTYPGSETNAGGPSFVVLESFSAPSADMSFVYRREAVSGAAPLDEPALRALRGAFEALPEGSGLLSTEEYLLLYGEDSVAVAAWGSATLAGRVPSAAPPAATPDGRMATFECGADGAGGSDGQGERCAIVVRNLAQPFDAPESVFEMPPEMGAARPVSPIVHASGPGGEAWHVLLEGGVHVAASASGTQAVSSGATLGLAAWRGADGTAPVAFGSGGVEIGGTTWRYTVDSGADVGVPVVGREDAGSMAALALVESGEILLLAPGGVTRRIDVRAAAAATGRSGAGALSRYPVLADMDGDHRLDVLAAMDSTVFAFTQSGALAAGFPVTFPARVTSQPLVFRFEGDAAWTALAAAEDGYLYAARADGGPTAPFPLEAGGSVHATPLLAGDRLVAVSSTGFAKAWRLPAAPEIWWGTLHGSGARHSFVSLAAPSDAPAADGLIDSRETYNWPNPIEGGMTHLRIRTSRDAEVRVTILDAGGARVGDVDMGNVVGGVPAEAVWRADVQSGLYFARFSARAADGSRATKLIKMAVIR